MDDVEEDWNDVIIECSSLSAKWEELSGYIGLSFRAIEAIQGDGKDTGNCWNKALKEWICQNYDTEKRHKPSWRTLLRAVAKVDKLFFDTLRRKHLVTRPLMSKSASVPTKVHQDQLSSICAPSERSQSLVGSQIGVSLHENESLHTGLKQDSITSVDSGLDASLGSEALSYSYPFLNVKGMSENEVVILKGRLTNDYRRINDQYSTLIRGVVRSLNERGATPKQLSFVLRDLNTFSVKKSTSYSLLEDRLDDIRKEESNDEAFYILRSYGSFFDCYILKHIVNNLGTGNDKANLEQYEKALYDYCKRNIFECPHFSNSDPNKRQLVLKVDEIVTTSFTLNTLSTFQANLAEVLGLEEHTLLLHSVEAGCLKITFQVPCFVVDAIFSLSAVQELELRNLGVIKITCGQRTIDLIPEQLKINSDEYEEWLKAWKSWAGTRKRGKMAQFIVQKLEENKQAKWLNITIGKFKLTEWHRIADEWFKEKPRCSDPVDAPCMLRKGLPRAFPGLDEVKGESIKEGTQYRSRVFQAPASLVQEVQLYMNKSISSVRPDISHYGDTTTGYNYVTAGGSMHSPSSIRMKTESDPLDIGRSPSSSDTASPYTYSNYDASVRSGEQRPLIKLNDSFVSLSELGDHLPQVSPTIHSRASISEQDGCLPPLRPTRSLKSRSMGQRRILMISYSDAADSGVSMNFDHDLEQEMLRRGSASVVSSGLYSLNSSVSQQLLSITIQAQEGEKFANGLQYECVYQVMEDFPPNSDSSNVVLKSGDRIIQVGDQLVRDKGPIDFAELLCSEASHGTTVKILPQLSSSSSGASVHSIASSIGYSSLDVAERKQLVQRQSDRKLASSLTTRVTNLLTMKASIYPRNVTVSFVAGEGWGFEVTGGNAVGIFISKVSSSRKELQVGDQVLELGGQSTASMSHYEATSILRSSKDKIQLRVAENIAKFTAIKDQFELESYYICSHVDHAPSDSKDMSLKKGGIVRVVNTVLFPGYWLAWSVDPNTGMDLDLRRIPSPSAAKQIHGKDVYEAVSAPQQQNISILSAS